MPDETEQNVRSDQNQEHIIGDCSGQEGELSISIDRNRGSSWKSMDGDRYYPD